MNPDERIELEPCLKVNLLDVGQPQLSIVVAAIGIPARIDAGARAVVGKPRLDVVPELSLVRGARLVSITTVLNSAAGWHRVGASFLYDSRDIAGAMLRSSVRRRGAR